MTGMPVLARRASWPILLLVVAGVTLVIVANGHLVYVAVTSQPACVPHVRSAAENGARGLFGAAKPACTP